MTSILPRPGRRRGFLVLTPLVDVIFLLLIFFMLSSQIAPYSLLPLGRVEGGGSPPQAAGEPSAAPMVVRVSPGEASLAGQRIALSELAETARELGRQGIEAYLLIPSAAASVQDVVSALEALKAASAASVTLLDPGHGTAPETGRARP